MDLPAVTILESRDGLFARTPGSVAFLGQARINRLAPLTGNEVLRQMPGVHVVDEEGGGLRMNLSVRGLDPDRSRGLLVLEDGVPVALAPYGEPELYYTPAMERMAGVELIKGSGQVLYGPQTIGGVVNYITADPPTTSQGSLRVKGGQGGLFHAMAEYGATTGNVGYRFHYLRKQADRLAYAGYRVNDLGTRFRFGLGPRADLSFKLGLYDEWSDATYIGLTQTMYDRGGQDFAAMAPDDRMTVRRYSASAVHRWDPFGGGQLKTTVYGYTTTRNWKRQDFSDKPSAAGTGVVWGDPAIPGGAVYMLDGVGHRNRQFEVAGAESRWSQDAGLLGKPLHLDVGVRLHYERAFEQRVNGTFSDASSGALVEDERRTGRALSLFAQGRWQMLDRLSLTAGIRGERFDHDREIFRNTFAGAVRDTYLLAGNSLFVPIPGLGLNWDLAPAWTLFAGLHRGFAPPRTKDAITKAGEALDLEAELSWNTEVGLRRRTDDGWGVEATLFHLDFSNQIIPVSESSGGTGTGLVNGGATLHQGIELGLDLRFGEWIGGRHQLDLHANTTLLRAVFDSDRFVATEQGPVNIRGNRTPYAPAFLQTATLSYLYDARWGLTASLTMAGRQYTDERNTMIPSADGRTGRIDGYRVLDLNGSCQFRKLPLKVGIAAKNLTDERYIVTRRPQGIRLGLPRYLAATAEFRF